MTMKMGAEKSAGRAATNSRNASIPPAETPIATDVWFAYRSALPYTTCSDSREGIVADSSNGPHAASPAPAAPFVVGLGASAGGIEALREFFAHVTPGSGTAYVVILHLSPDHESRLAEVLQTTATIPVTQVTERTTIEVDRVYVVPPNKLLALDHQSIMVAEMTLPEQRRAPVDLFFRSLADAQRARAICVVLSGTGPNGSSGLKRVKQYGGVVIVQDPEEAEYGEMPRNSIATGLVDFVLPIAAIPDKIRWCQQRLGVDIEDSADVATVMADPEALRNILTLLRERTGQDFSNYKPSTIQRRVERRVHLRNLPSLSDYARTLREDADEAVALMKDLLISVTNFFRDPASFEVFMRAVVPRLFLHKGSQDQVRAWVAGCATGEEAYSIAMLLTEYASLSPDSPTIQVFATDLDEQSIAMAREARYTVADVADLSEERLQRFFTREADGYRVRRELRETVLFAHHNLIKDPPFSHLDLVSCRNLLIYLNRSAQLRALETFHFALRSGGYLFLGTSESPDVSDELFAVVDKGAHLYEARSATSRLNVRLAEHQPLAPVRMPARTPETRVADRISAGELHQRLLEQYAPPSVVINEEHYVLHMSQRAGRFMHIVGGEPTRDLLRMVRDELRPDLRAALHQAMRERTIVEVKDVATVLENGEHRVDITVYPVLWEADPARGHLLVTFDEKGDQRRFEETRRVASGPVTAHLEDELMRVKQQLRATIEQYETYVEEAKASNEELQAMNEELRSAAEELETSKEELQSVNEELTTVNQELKIKIEELGLTNDNFQNLINSTDIGTIFLDRDLRVKLSTPTASHSFNLLRTDVGRPLSDITSQLRYDNLHSDVRQVLDDLRTIDREVQTEDGKWTLTRIRPYRTMDDRIDGVVITFQDITQRRHAEDRLRLLIDGATEYAIFTMTNTGEIDSWNSGAERMFGYRADEIIGQNVETLFTPEDRAAGVPAGELKKAAASGRTVDERFHARRDGSRFYCSASTIALGEKMGFAKIARDLSAQQQTAEALRVVEAEFEVRVRERTDALTAEVQARDSAHARVTDLLRRIVTAQEDERARIARDLHDQLGQQLTALRLGLQRHRNRLAATVTVDEDVDRALSLADRIETDLDFLSWQLRPAVLDDLGLSAALPLFVREWSEYHGVPAEYRSGGYASGVLGQDAELVFYRVAQEALNNVTKHAHASRVDVMLEARDGSVVLVVEDDGVGFDLSDRETRNKGIGIVGMQERASLIGATLQVESKPGDGTSVFLRCATTAPRAPERVT
jgi:two-component system, chemotaxis family, CheB/CheR fusion protein